MLLENLGKYPHLMSAFTAKRSLVQTKLVRFYYQAKLFAPRYLILTFQEFLQHITKNLLFCLLGLVIWGCTEVFSPDFFNYPYLYIPFTWYVKRPSLQQSYFSKEKLLQDQSWAFLASFYLFCCIVYRL